MIDVSSLRGTSTVDTPSASQAARQSLGQDQFLTLMLTQLKNQDPMKPLEPSEFLGQLAQFSTVTGIQEMQQSISALSGAFSGNSVLEGATMVGRDVLAATSIGRLGVADELRAAVGTPEGANRITVNVRDAAGSLVRRFDVDAADGIVDFAWDGLTNEGQRAPAGVYRLDAVANVGGRNESLEMMIRNRVNSVSVDAQGRGLTLNTASGTLALGDVRRIM